MKRIVNSLLILTLLFCWTTDLSAVKDVLKPDGYFTPQQLKELDMGSKRMQERKAATSESNERFEAMRGLSGAGTASSERKDLGDDVVPLKVDPAATQGERFPSEIAYDDGSTGMGGFIFEDDSASVWFRPLTDAYFTGFGMYFYDGTELTGTDVTIELRDVLDGPIVDPAGVGGTIDGNGEYDFTPHNVGVAPYHGAVLWSTTFPLTASDVYPNWFQVDIDESAWVDVGSRDFAITLAIPGADEADLLYYAGYGGAGVPYNHGFKWYHTGGGYCAPNPCWVPRLNFVVHAYVDYYGDPPPFVENVQQIDDVYYSCNPGPYDVTADIYDLGTGDFAGELTSVLFVVDDGSGVLDTTDVIGQNDPTVGGTYTGSIPDIGAGGSVNYWWSATDNGSQAEGGVDHTADGQFSPIAFAVHEASGANVLLLADHGTTTEYMAAATGFMNDVGYLNDNWNTAARGTPGSCELSFYGTIIIGQGLNGTGSFGVDGFEAAIMAHMDAGGKLVLISDDYIYGLGDAGGAWTSTDASAYPFLANYLHVSDYCSDCVVDSLYAGVDGTVGDGLGEFMAHPQWPDHIIGDDDTSPAFLVWSDDDGDYIPIGGIQFNDGSGAYIPWDMDFAGEDIQVGFAANLMAYLGEMTGPALSAVAGPSWGIPAGAQDLDFHYNIGDFDGSITSADLHMVINDGGYTVSPLSDNGDGTWSVTVAVALTDTSSGEYAVAAYDDSGNMGMSAEVAFYGVDWAGTGAQILYMFEGYAGYESYGPAAADSILKANLDAVGVGYDHWDVVANGLADNGTVTSNYEGVLYAGAYDWHLWPEASADHPLTAYVDGGGYLLYSSEEVLGEYTNWEDIAFAPGHFVYDVLGVEWVGNDYNYAAVAAYDDGGAGLIDGLSDSAIYLDSLMFPLTGVSMADLCDPVGYGTEDMRPPLFLGLYAPPNGYYAGSLNGTSAFLAFIMAQMPDDQQQILLGNWVDILSIDNDVDGLPLEFTLNQNYPNPFNPTTTLSFAIPMDSKVDLVVYNLLGQEVTRIFDHKLMRAGAHEIVWDGKDELGNSVGTGLYVYRLNAAGKSAAQKMMLLK
ncbi:MAG: FlgD immunoglobulin-like domain containing protein [Candidatus Marinimicrobia bacterium]|nr:FlgD immunoglobulin-like domain containing protein [Candidatus Neomarinimicrobiota bacterium]